MTYNELYKSTKGWTARHIAQDLLMGNGKDAIVSDHDQQQVQEAEARDSQ